MSTKPTQPADEGPDPTEPAAPVATPEATTAPSADQTAVRRTTAILLTAIAILFIWYVVADRLTPYTSSARFKTYVVSVTPDVSGYIEKIAVKKSQLAEAGDPLVHIETRRFELDAQAAEAELELAGQDVGAKTASVAVVTERLAAARSVLNEVRAQAARILALEAKDIAPKAQADEARAAVAAAEASVRAAEAEVERAKQQLGAGGATNPRMKRAIADLERAQLNLSRTTLIAPSKGWVGSLKIDEGTYAVAGQPVMTFLSADDFWVEAYMTENNLGRVEPGDKVELAFDAFPGEIFEGKVKSISLGVSTGKKAGFGDLPTVETSRAWLRDPQRFPVIIETTNYTYSDTRQGLRLNSQVDVTIYTGDHLFWNALAKLWIRIMSWFSYVY